MKVKICGITNFKDANEAIELGADALGFVFYEKSPRFINSIDVREIIKKLPPFVEKVGLFVNVDAKTVNKIAKQSGITLAQIHFEADSSFYDELEIPHIKVVRASEKSDILKYSGEYRIVDAFVESYGGEGKRVNLSWFDGIDKSKIILAGGLNENNLAEVLNLGFYGVDVSSGVEKAKGKKDTIKVKKFIETAKNGKI